MQGTTRMDRELFDAAEIAGELVPPGSVFAFLAQHRGELFDDEFIADLFPSKTGRPSLPADLIGSVLVLKELYDLGSSWRCGSSRPDLTGMAILHCSRSTA